VRPRQPGAQGAQRRDTAQQVAESDTQADHGHGAGLWMQDGRHGCGAFPPGRRANRRMLVLARALTRRAGARPRGYRGRPCACPSSASASPRTTRAATSCTAPPRSPGCARPATTSRCSRQTCVSPGAAGAEDPPWVHRELRAFDPAGTWPGLRAAAAGERHNARVLRSHLRAFGPDAVCFWRMGELSLSLLERVRRAGIPAVGVVCDPWPLEAPERDPWHRAVGRRLGGTPDWARLARWVFVSGGSPSGSRGRACPWFPRGSPTPAWTSRGCRSAGRPARGAGGCCTPGGCRRSRASTSRCTPSRGCPRRG
jgi:hypothetical protein